jgi:heme exporter protein B
VLIFGVSAVDAIMNGFEAKAQLLILGAFFLAALPLCTWAAATSIKQAIE